LNDLVIIFNNDTTGIKVHIFIEESSGTAAASDYREFVTITNIPNEDG